MTIIAVPPGVGDTYWALTKLKSFRQRHGIEHVTLAVQKTTLKRACEWPQMVDFVEEATELRFAPDPLALHTGFSEGAVPRAHYCFWPNAVVDRGLHLREWLPEYDLDLDFTIKTEEPTPPRDDLAVVYHSSDSIHQAWFPNLDAQWWHELSQLLAAQMRTGIVGAFWDLRFRSRMPQAQHHVEDLIGQTTLPQVAGVLQRARVVVGVICGMTILANHFKTPTVAFCPDKFPADFPRTWVKPDAPYVVLRPSEIHSPAQVAEVVLDLAKRTPAALQATG